MSDEAESALRAELPYSHRFIRVSLGEGRATLGGEVEWPYQKESAERALRAVPGVNEVRNLITVRPAVDAAQALAQASQDRRRSAGSLHEWAAARRA
jgi:osmotically-inducible protein OsmY